MKNHLMTLAMMLAFVPLQLSAQYNPVALEKAKETMDAFKDKDSKFEVYFDDAYGYAVFPSVGKGAFVLGGAHGAGTAFELGEPVGKAKITQLTIGFQAGGQAYRQIIFFESEADMQRFKDNKIEFAAQASAVAVTEGASTNLAYNDGVAVFTMTKGGLMYEASLGGQQLTYKPYKRKPRR